MLISLSIKTLTLSSLILLIATPYIWRPIEAYSDRQMEASIGFREKDFTEFLKGEALSLVLDASISNLRILYAGILGVGVFRSIDGGLNWTQFLVVPLRSYSPLTKLWLI